MRASHCFFCFGDLNRYIAWEHGYIIIVWWDIKLLDWIMLRASVLEVIWNCCRRKSPLKALDVLCLNFVIFCLLNEVENLWTNSKTWGGYFSSHLFTLSFLRWRLQLCELIINGKTSKLTLHWMTFVMIMIFW